MSGEDRFGDLGARPGRDEDGPSAAERLEEEDRLRPEPDMPPKRPEVPRPANKYAWAVGIVMLMGISVLLFTTALPNIGAGVSGPPRGEALPDFAAPSATGNLEGDANVLQSRTDTQKGVPPACEVRGDDVVNICDLRKRPVLLTFIFDRGADCNPQIDRVQRVSDEFPGVSFVTVFFTDEERAEIAALVRRRGWTMPVAIDADGAVANLYNVGGCPTTVVARAGGEVVAKRRRNLTEDELRGLLGKIAR